MCKDIPPGMVLLVFDGRFIPLFLVDPLDGDSLYIYGRRHMIVEAQDIHVQHGYIYHRDCVRI